MEKSSESLQFELLPYKTAPKKQLPTAGVKGDVGHFGPVVVERCPIHRPLRKGMDDARLSGPAFPEAIFTGKRRSGRPSLFKAELLLDGRRAELEFNSRALRKQDRALRIRYEGREYVYVIEDLGRVRALTREGVRVSIGPGRHVPPATTYSAGTATGPVDAVDLAIAILLEEVDTDVLTLTGAALSSPFALMQRFSDGAE
ncbi:hypothetical protein ACFTZ8_22465 [Streptomyces fungicidicus]|uniref:Uncharacterized protein n=1 Tax=Streptomyces fungicidicus TaxID=68203 RepID=A0A494V3F8_9ACTN|nr:MULTISPECIES: hypothetical protein [Streptomyces]AYL36768.1 hypothetical protein CNQ36_15845 [Streptomyces fungicidicus]TQL21720.1 hypothetical protein FBY37_3726 [Streptomyces sp. SLBN-134]